jgi:hypothetical protein
MQISSALQSGRTATEEQCWLKKGRERGGTEDAEMKERAVRGHGEAARERETERENYRDIQADASGQEQWGMRKLNSYFAVKIFFWEVTGRESNHSASDEQAVQLNCSELIIERSQQ